MNLGLGTLTDLKAHLLNEALRSNTAYDAKIAALGKGIAARMEGYCNRKFQRVVDDTFECTADRYHVTLPRSPLEAVPAIAQRDDLTIGFVDQVFTDLALGYDLKAGLIDFGRYCPGLSTSRLRFTFTGGYWFPDTDAATPETEADLPAGATLLPSDLRLAWLLQCERTWSVTDNLGINIAGDKPVTFVSSTLAALDLVPEVKAMLQPFMRYALT